MLARFARTFWCHGRGAYRSRRGKIVFTEAVIDVGNANMRLCRGWYLCVAVLPPPGFVPDSVLNMRWSSHLGEMKVALCGGQSGSVRAAFCFLHIANICSIVQFCSQWL